MFYPNICIPMVVKNLNLVLHVNIIDWTVNSHHSPKIPPLCVPCIFYVVSVF